jgi:hypothetical protein
MAALDGNARALLLHHAQPPSNLYCQEEPRNTPLPLCDPQIPSLACIYIYSWSHHVPAPVGATIGRLWQISQQLICTVVRAYIHMASWAV